MTLEEILGCPAGKWHNHKDVNVPEDSGSAKAKKRRAIHFVLESEGKGGREKRKRDGRGMEME